MQFQERKRWLFFGLPFTFTTYRVTEEYITVKSGLLRQKEDDCYMYKIVDTRLVRSLPERFFGLGTVECFGGDTTDPVLHLSAIPRRSRTLFLRLLRNSARRKRRSRPRISATGAAALHPWMWMETGFRTFRRSITAIIKKTKKSAGSC